MNTKIGIAKLARLQEEAELRSEKRADKKRDLARNAIVTLGQLGYARTSLRDIAEQSGVSVGILHYYFEDKIDLISFCVQMYKDEFIAELDAATVSGSSTAATVDAFITALSDAIERHADTHTLWYDISSQAFFDIAFRPVVAEIEDALIKTVGRLLARTGHDGSHARGLYLACDGVFRHYLLRHIAGDDAALAAMREDMAQLFSRLTTMPPSI